MTYKNSYLSLIFKLNFRTQHLSKPIQITVSYSKWSILVSNYSLLHRACDLWRLTSATALNCPMASVSVIFKSLFEMKFKIGFRFVIDSRHFLRDKVVIIFSSKMTIKVLFDYWELFFLIRIWCSNWPIHQLILASFALITGWFLFLLVAGFKVSYGFIECITFIYICGWWVEIYERIPKRWKSNAPSIVSPWIVRRWRWFIDGKNHSWDWGRKLRKDSYKIKKHY